MFARSMVLALALAGTAMPVAAQVGSPAQPQIALPGPQAISEADRQVGAKADPDLTAEYGGAYTGPQAALVRTVGLKVARQSGIASPESVFSFKLLNSGVPNAFAIPGGYVYTTRGLLALMNNEAELGFVLGHETGHIAARHTQERQKVTQRSVLAGALGQAVLGAILGNGALGQVGGQLGQAGINRLVVGTVMSHSRKDEYQADDLGVAYMQKAGYDAATSGDILGSLAAQTALDAKGSGRARTTPGWAMSHPDPASRVVRARQRAAQLGTRGGARNDAAFLLALKGMIYGDDPAQGVIEGQVFRYPTGRVQFTAPAGYGMSNGTDAVTISAASGARVGGQARFTGGRYDGNLSGVVTQAFAAITNDASAAAAIRPTATRVNGMEAMTATVGASSNGQALDVTVVAIALSPTTAYAFTVLQPRGAGLGDLAGLVNSFGRMSDAEVAAVRPRLIDVVTVGKTDTVAKMAARMAFTDYRTERFLVLNGLPAGTTRLTPGRKVKLVVWGPAGKY